MRILTTTALLGALALGAMGCKTVYEPVEVDGDVRAGVIVPPTPGPDDQAAVAPVEGRPGRFVLLRAHRVVDWDRVGDVTCDVLQGTGVVLLYSAEITLRVLAACAQCACR